jgi:hypothetical protein
MVCCAAPSVGPVGIYVLCTYAKCRSWRAHAHGLLMHPTNVFPPPRRPACSWKISRHQYNQIVAATQNFQEDSLSFMSKVLARSGLGDETYAPPSEWWSSPASSQPHQKQEQQQWWQWL